MKKSKIKDISKIRLCKGQRTEIGKYEHNMNGLFTHPATFHSDIFSHTQRENDNDANSCHTQTEALGSVSWMLNILQS